MNHINYQTCSAFTVTLLVAGILLLTNGCEKNNNVPIECVTNHILANVEKEKIEEFIKLEGVNIWREGWGNMTSSIAEDNYVVEKCGIRQYLAQYEIGIDDLKGQMVFVYSMHSYLKYGYVNQETIVQQVDSLLFE